MNEIWETNIEMKSLTLNVMNIKGGKYKCDLNFLLNIYKILYDNFGTGMMGEIMYPIEFADMYLYIKEVKQATLDTFLQDNCRWYADLYFINDTLPFYFKNDVDLFYAKILLSDIGD